MSKQAIADMGIKAALSRFSPSDAGIAELRAKYEGLEIQGVEDAKGLRAADDARKDVKRHRCAVDNTRKELIADALEWQRLVNAEAARLKAPLKELEDGLAGKVDAVKAEKARLAEEERKRKAAVLQSRMEALHAVRSTRPSMLVEEMSEEEFEAALAEDTAVDEKKRQEEEAERKRAEERERELAEREEKQNRTARRLKALAEVGCIKLPADVEDLSDEDFGAMFRETADAWKQAEDDRKAQEQRKRQEEAEAKAKADSERKAREEAEERERKQRAERRAGRLALLGRARCFDVPDDVEDLSEEEFASLLSDAQEAQRQVEREAEAAREKAETERKKREEELKPQRQKVLEFADWLETDLEGPDVWCKDEIHRVLTNAAAQIRCLANEPVEAEEESRG